jgi:hypothetical protein
MAFEYTTSLYVPSLPSPLVKKMEARGVFFTPVPEFSKHTLNTFEGKQLRGLFSAHLDARNQACGALMEMLHSPEADTNSAKWFQFCGALQQEDQYLRTIAEYYNKKHAKQ